MKRMFLASSVALPCLIALGLNCSADDSVVKPAPTGTGAGTTTTTGSPTTTTGSPTTTTGSPTTTTVGAGGDTGAGVGGAAGATGAGGAGTAGAGGIAGAGGGKAGAGGAGGAPGNSICVPGTGANFDCTAVLKTMSGISMDGYANIDPPASVIPPDGIQGPSQIDGVNSTAMTAGIPCQGTETRPDHGLPIKWVSWQLMGPGVTAGTMYAVTIQFTGVVECKTYISTASANCAIARTADPGRAMANDLWCQGGTDPALTVTPDHYNTDMLSVTPTRSGTTPNLGPATVANGVPTYLAGPLPTAGNWWMLNQCPQGVGESHQTRMINYTKTITVPGGSWINFTEFDTNCREIINCGTSNDAQTSCPTHFMIVPSNTNPPAPASVTAQPASAGGGNYGQWIYFDVVNIAPM